MPTKVTISADDGEETILEEVQVSSSMDTGNNDPTNSDTIDGDATEDKGQSDDIVIDDPNAKSSLQNAATSVSKFQKSINTDQSTNKKRKSAGQPASISPSCTPKKVKKSGKAKSVSKPSSISPAMKKATKSTSKSQTRPVNAPSIMNFFMKKTASNKVNSSDASTTSKSNPATSTSSNKQSNGNKTVNVATATETRPSQSKSVGNDKSSSSVKQSSAKINSCNQKPESSSLPTSISTSLSPKSNKTESNYENDILENVLGTNAGTNSNKKHATKKSRKTSRKKVVHLPHLITQDLDVDDIYKTDEIEKKQSSSTKSQPPVAKKGKAPKDPLKPKHFKTAYVFYGQAVRSNVVKENPDMSPNEITKHISKNFKELSADEKKVYDDMAATDKSRYQREMEDYNNKQKPSEVESTDDGLGEEDQSNETEQNEDQHDDAVLTENKYSQPDDHESDESAKESDLYNDLFAEDCPDASSENITESPDVVDPSEEQDLENDQLVIEDEQNDDDITLGSQDDDRSCDEGGETKEDQGFISLEDEVTCDPESNDEVLEESDGNIFANDQSVESKSNNAGTVEEVKSDEANVVNILQPRKKVDSPIVNTLQPRKKVSVNQLEPRKKMTINELKPHKKVKSDSLPNTKTDDESTLKPKQLFVQSHESNETKVNELKPRKKTTSEKVVKSPIIATGSKPESKPELESKTSTKSLQAKPAESTNSVSVELSEEEKANLTKYQKIKAHYLNRVTEIVDNAINGAGEEEDFQTIQLDDDCCAEKTDVSEKLSVITEFKDEWVEQIATLVQGR